MCDIVVHHQVFAYLVLPGHSFNLSLTGPTIQSVTGPFVSRLIQGFTIAIPEI